MRESIKKKNRRINAEAHFWSQRRSFVSQEQSGLSTHLRRAFEGCREKRLLESWGYRMPKVRERRMLIQVTVSLGKQFLKNPNEIQRSKINYTKYRIASKNK